MVEEGPIENKMGAQSQETPIDAKIVIVIVVAILVVVLITSLLVYCMQRNTLQSQNDKNMVDMKQLTYQEMKRLK